MVARAFPGDLTGSWGPIYGTELPCSACIQWRFFFLLEQLDMPCFAAAHRGVPLSDQLWKRGGLRWGWG